MKFVAITTDFTNIWFGTFKNSIRFKWKSFEVLKIFLDFTNLDLSALFLYCVQIEKFQILKYLIASKKDCLNEINVVTMKLVCMQNEIETLKLFIETKGMDFLKDPNTDLSESLLSIACETGNFELLKYFLEIGLDFEKEVTKTGETTFFSECSKGRLAIVKFFVEVAKIDINKTNHFGISAAFHACFAHQFQVVKYLILNPKFDVNSVCHNGDSLFWNCVDRQNLETVKLLIEKGVNTNVHVNEKSAFWNACYLGNLDIVKAIVEDGLSKHPNTNYFTRTNLAGESAFYIAVQHNRISIVKYLLEMNHKLNLDLNLAEKKDSKSPFWVACSLGISEIVEELSNHKEIDKNATNSKRETPFYIALTKSHYGIVDYLLKNFGLSDNDKTKINENKIES